MLALALKYGPKILAGLALVALIGLGYHAIYQRGYRASDAPWAAKWTARDLAETQAKDAALAAQKAAQDATDARNASIVETLTNVAKERDNALLDAQFARRLLGAARAAPAGGAVPSASDQPGAAAPGAAGGDAGAGRLSGLVADFRTECRLNADDWDVLQAELAPQITSAVPR